jgi:hypothetical protein
MRKAIFIAVLLIVTSVGESRAQSIVQLTEQLVLDYQKLSELKGILQDMYDAYKIIDNGLSDVKDIVNGNFDLHKAFLDGLMAVSPTVKNYVRVADILQAEYTIVSEYKSGFSRFKASGHFTADEISYISNVYSSLVSRSLDYLNQLTIIITSNQLRMGDAERLAGIDRIYTGISGNLAFLRRFNGATSVQDVQRAKEAVDLGLLNSLF